MVDFVRRVFVVVGFFSFSIFGAYTLFDESLFIDLFNSKISTDMILVNAYVAFVGFGVLGGVATKYYLRIPLDREANPMSLLDDMSVEDVEEAGQEKRKK